MGFVCKLEDDLISPKKWKELYDEMPPECKRQVDGPNHYPTGIGRNEELGWFVMATGQGPILMWSEKEMKERKEMIQKLKRIGELKKEK